MRARALVPCLLLLGSAASLASHEDPAPTLAAGEHLLAEANCSACHGAQPGLLERIAPRTGPHLGAVGARLEPRSLRRFLLRPHATQPGTPMPDLLAGLPEDERERAADELVQYLSSLGGPFDAGPEVVYADELERGRQLYHSVGCIACHAPQEGAGELAMSLWEPRAEASGALYEDEPAYVRPGTLPPGEVPLGDLVARTNLASLAAFLADPLALRPDGLMPSLSLSGAEARAIAAYLLRHQASADSGFERRTPGLAYEYYEAPMEHEVVDLSGLLPQRRGVAAHLAGLPEHRADHFAFRFHGLLEVPRRGTWGFATTSDDGSRLWIGERLVVQNDGFHPMQRATGKLWLEAGLHPIAVTYFEQEGGEGLLVEWQGPGVPREVLPPAALSHLALELAPPRARALRADPDLIEAGRARFAALRCGACHAVAGDGAQGPSAAPLAELRADALGGCLAPAPGPGLPRYAFDEAERAALAYALANLAQLEAPLTPHEQVARTLERFACLRCHERGGVGGLHPERADYFIPLDEALDLGDQARYPPILDQVGRKLRAARLGEFLTQGAKSRPYLAARMPRFGERNVGTLAALLAEVDLRPGDDLEPRPDPERISQGRRLVGTSGLGCVQCHAFAGFEALGTPAVDLADAFAHTRPGWFADLLRDPSSVGLLSRMPQMWMDGQSPVPELCGGDIEEQLAAIRAYLSLGRGAPLPEGLVLPEGTYELVVGAEPVLCGVFFEGASPRTMLVGSPEGLHYAFDMQHSRLVAVWRGRFFDARGTWHGRAGALERPPVEDALLLEPGMALAVLEAPDAPWPEPIGRAAGFQRLGQRFDAERYPVWRYRLGELEIEEHLRPRLGADGLYLTRAFELEGEGAQPPALYLRTSDGQRLRVPFAALPERSTPGPRWSGRIETRIAW